MLFLWVLPNTGKHNLKPGNCATHGPAQKRIIMSLIVCFLFADVLADLERLLDSTENFQRDHLNDLLKVYADEKQLKYKQFMKSMRGILSGLKEGPGVAEMMEILGKRSTIQRIRNSRG